MDVVGCVVFLKKLNDKGFMKQLVYAALLIVLTAACNKNSDSAIPDTKSGINVFQAVRDNSAFDVLLDTIQLGKSMVFGTNTGYQFFRARKYNLAVYVAGDRTRLLAGGEINLRNNRQYSIFIGVDTSGRRLVVNAAEDTLSAPQPGKARLRFVNLSDTYKPNKQALGLDFYTNGRRIERGIGFQTITNFRDIDADSTYNLDVRWVDSSLSLLKGRKEQITIRDQQIFTVIIAGNALDTSKLRLIRYQNK